MREELHAYCTLWQRLGLREVRRYWDMERPLHDPIDEPGPIEGVIIRPFRQTVDNEAALAAFNDSFSDHYRPPYSLCGGRNYWMASPDVRTDQSWLAEDEQDPRPHCGLLRLRDTQNALGARRRPRGLDRTAGDDQGPPPEGAGARLAAARPALAARRGGRITALLGVDSESLTGANRLYESVGFRIRRREMQYEAPLALVNA